MRKWAALLALSGLIAGTARSRSRLGQTAQSRTTAASAISGHVYSADTGKPLVDAVVTLESTSGNTRDQSQRTATDGSYRLAGVGLGNYWVYGYKTGFIIRIYGDNGDIHGRGQACQPFCVSVGSASLNESISAWFRRLR